MPPKPTQPFTNRHAYIPPHVQQTMDRHMQQSLPANLKKYTESNGYIPKHAERAIAQHMEKAVPNQFKKYAGAYVQQKVMSQHLELANAGVPPPAPNPAAPRPVTYAVAPEQTQSVSPGETVVPTATPGPAPNSQQPSPSASPAPTEPPNAYSFITNPEMPVKSQGLRLPGGNSLIARAAFIVGGLVVLLIVFSVIKGLLSGGGNFPSFLSITQDQQELIHISGEASQQQNLTTNNQNFAATLQLALTSSQTATIQYLANNGHKVNLKTLNLKVSLTTDNQLTAAAAATTYDQTFQEIMQAKLATYITDLKQTYQQTPGKKGRALLSNTYSQAQLLLTQLNAPSQ